MPQYKKFQYGLKQYGRYLVKTENPSLQGHWRFVRSRFGVRRNGTTFWLYQHTAQSVAGKTQKLRIGTNLGEWIIEEKISLKGQKTAVRLSSNLQKDPIEAHAQQWKGRTT